MSPSGPATLSDYDFDLPEERIALHPATPRDASRLLVVRPEGHPELSDHIFSELPAMLAPGDLLVFNDTKVIPARLLGERIRDENRVAIEALLLKRRDESTWDAFAKPGKRLKPGDTVRFGGQNPACEADTLTGTILEKGEEGVVTIRFDRAGAFLDEAIALVGSMPLPPYILEARKRLGDTATGADPRDYQTVFAAQRWRCRRTHGLAAFYAGAARAA